MKKMAEWFDFSTLQHCSAAAGAQRALGSGALAGRTMDRTARRRRGWDKSAICFFSRCDWIFKACDWIFKACD